MGCAYSPVPKEIMYHAVDYLSVDTIQGLLRFHKVFRPIAEQDMNAEVLCIYLDIDEALNNIDISERQQEALDYYMDGWTEEQIGLIMKNTHQAVHKLITKVCKKIVKFFSLDGCKSGCKHTNTRGGMLNSKLSK